MAFGWGAPQIKELRERTYTMTELQKICLASRLDELAWMQRQLAHFEVPAALREHLSRRIDEVRKEES